MEYLLDQVPGTDFKIYQDRNKFSYGTDAIFLSDFAKTKGIVVDLGTGTGIIPLRIAGRKDYEKIYALEIQKEVYEMAADSVRLNGLEDRIEVLNMDIKDVEGFFGRHTVDTVVTNPPYMKTGGALVNQDDNFAISRHELLVDLEDIIGAAEHMLKPLGRFYMVHRPNRLVDIFHLMRLYRIEPKSLRMVQARSDKPANLVLVEGIKHGRPELRIMENLLVYKEDGSYTDEIMDIYYKEV